MSNTLQYDSLLVRALAAELDRTWSGRRLDAVHFERETHRVSVHARSARRRDVAPSLLWQLHPSSGHLTHATSQPESGRVQLGAPATVRSVSAPPDERILIFDLETHDAPAGHANRIIIELITNQWNAVATAADDRIVAVLRERSTKSRVLRAGVPYTPPRPSGRSGAVEPIPPGDWMEALSPTPPGERLRALLGFAAYTGPVSAAWILGDADVHAEPAALERAHERYLRLVWPDDEPVGAFVLRTEHGAQPYPQPVTAECTPATSLMHAFEQAAESADAAPVRPDANDAALATIARRIDTIGRRLGRLREEQSGAADEATRLRHHADTLLSQLHRVERGASTVELDDFAGGTVTVELDPAQSAAENATRLYDTARRRDRAAARIPKLIVTGTSELQRLEKLAGRVREGTATDQELARLRARQERSGRPGEEPSLPYREYRTSGGLEVRVGRGSKANDDLTFRHSSPNDIWLHARDVGGAHVILRWSDKTANPPASELSEAANLAALHSKARTSGMVAVDWTRRKHVRKPRKAAPGLVLPERVKTVFVEPDRGLEERLKALADD